MAERRYDQRELAQILRDAGKLQLSGSDGEDGAGLTLGEIQRVAGEVGIDPAHVSAAAARLRGASKSGGRRWGAPTQMIEERIVPGELSEAAWEDIVTDLRSTIGSIGTVSTFGSGREWIGGSDFITCHLRTSIRDGKTHLRLTYRQMGGIAFSWIMAGVICFVTATLTGARLHKAGLIGPESFGLALVAVAVVAAACYLFVANWGRNNRETFDSLLEHIEQIAEGSNASSVNRLSIAAESTGESEISTSLST